jgi:hypothetical protein
MNTEMAHFLFQNSPGPELKFEHIFPVIHQKAVLKPVVR